MRPSFETVAALPPQDEDWCFSLMLRSERSERLEARGRPLLRDGRYAGIAFSIYDCASALLQDEGGIDAGASLMLQFERDEL
jgi:hypothetical protein